MVRLRRACWRRRDILLTPPRPLHPAGKLLASGGLDGVTKIWDVATASVGHELEGPSEGIEWGCWHPKGPVYLAGAGDATIWMWNAPTANCMMVFSGHADTVSCGGFTPDGKKVVSGSAGPPPTPAHRPAPTMHPPLALLRPLSSDRRRLADGSVKVWNPKTGAVATNFPGNLSGGVP